MNNLYVRWCKDNGREPVSDYAFKCTAAGGRDHLADIRGSGRNFFVATTVDLLTTGVDVPPVTEIVFFKYVASPIAFYQMVGRGTRLYPPANKLMFTVYDYTNATRLFGEDFKSVTATRNGEPKICPEDETETERTIEVSGIEVKINNAGTYILTTDDSGASAMLTLEEYKQRLAARLVEDAPTLDDFRQTWVEPEKRHEMIERLPDTGHSPHIVRELTDMKDYDLYGRDRRTGLRTLAQDHDRAGRCLRVQERKWLETLPQPSSTVIRAIASQFAQGGTESLESPYLFKTPEVARAGGSARCGR